MRIVKGYQLKVQDTFQLTEEDCEHLVAKMGIFAISLKRVFDDPIEVQEDCIIAHYTREEYAHETLTHVQQYLYKIKMEGKVRVTLVDMKLSLSWDDTWLPE